MRTREFTKSPTFMIVVRIIGSVFTVKVLCLINPECGYWVYHKEEQGHQLPLIKASWMRNRSCVEKGAVDCWEKYEYWTYS